MKVTHDQKLEIVRLHRNGLKSAEIVKELRRRGDDISRDNVRYWVSQYTRGLFGHGDGDSGETCVTFTAVSERTSDQLEKNLLVDGFQSCREVHNDHNEILKR